jgi:hypothetical protein
MQELMLVRLAVDRQIPLLGICRGIQVLSAALGGKLYQDICTQHDRPCIEHSQTIARGLPSHSVSIEKGSLLYTILKTDRLAVNSFHHQAVKEVPAGFRVTATAPDGIIEAMESTAFRDIIGVHREGKRAISPTRGDGTAAPALPKHIVIDHQMDNKRENACTRIAHTITLLSSSSRARPCRFFRRDSRRGGPT